MVGVLGSARGILEEPTTTTYWAAKDLIDDLVARHQIRFLGNIGNCPDWNACKTGLINELRSDPSDCFVLHDLSKETEEGLRRRINRFDALFVLDGEGLPAGFLVAAPGLNRAYGSIDEVLASGPFQEVETRFATELPPGRVFVRKR